jgi:hypothetical protein
MDRALIRGLRVRGIDLTTADEQGLRSALDTEQLAFAARKSRALVTSNIADFARLHTEYVSTGRHHAGIIAIQQQRWSVGEQLRRLMSLVQARTVDEMVDTFVYLSAWAD